MAIPSFNAWRANSGAPTTPPVTPGGTSPTPSGGTVPSFKSWSTGSVPTIAPPAPLPIAPPDTRSIFGKISDTGGNLAASFVTGLGTMSGGILDQIFHLGTSFLKQKEGLVDTGLGLVEKGLDKAGINSSGVKKIKDFELANKLDSYRLKFKENLAGGADFARETNPMANTFAGQTAEVIGGVVPQVALAFAKVPQLALALSESVMNTEDSYDKNIKAGMDHTEALKRALPQLGADLLGTYITNKLGAVGKFGGVGKNVFKSAIAEGLKDASLEVVQEVWQQGLQNLATDKPFTEGMGETAKLTLIPALLFGAAGNIGTVQNKQEQKAKVSQAVSVMNEKIAKGQPLTEQEKALQAITEGVDPFLQEQIPSAIPPTLSSEQALEAAKAKTPTGITLNNEPLFHGTNEQFDTLDSTKQKTGRYTGNYLTGDKNYAAQFGDIVKEVPTSGNFFDISSSAKENEALKQFNVDEKGLQQELQKQGYDGIKLGYNEYVQFPKTKESTNAPQGTSKIAKSVEAKSIEAGLTKGFSDLAGYDKITIKDQSERAAALINENIDEARAILRGEKELPSGLKGTALIKAMEDHILKNPSSDLSYELANSPLITGTSEAAQELRLAAERDPDSATSKIQEIKKAREEKAGKGKTERAKKTVKKLVEATKEVNLSKEDLQWDNFLDSITC